MVYLGCPPPLTVVLVVVEPVSLLLLQDDVCVCVVVVVHGLPCALLFGLVAVVPELHVFVLSPKAGTGAATSPATTSIAAMVLRMGYLLHLAVDGARPLHRFRSR
jgi:hypothetical protein